MKLIELLLLRLVVYLLQSRDVDRSPWISRHDNKELWGMSERIEKIIERMENNYKEFG